MIGIVIAFLVGFFAINFVLDVIITVIAVFAPTFTALFDGGIGGYILKGIVCVGIWFFQRAIAYGFLASLLFKLIG